MSRFPRGIATMCVLLLAVGSNARAQTPEPPPPTLSTNLPQEALSNLPSGSDTFSLFETMQAEMISDRIDTAGLSTGEAARIGAHGSSWTQTLFRVGDIDITDPSGSGRPLLIPEVLQWEHIDLATGLMPIDTNAPTAVNLMPRRPTGAWTSSIETSVSSPAMITGRTLKNPPAIARLNSWLNSSLFASGPLVANRVGLVLAASWTKSARFERADPSKLDADARSVFANIVFTPTAHDEIQTVVWGQGTQFPSPTRIAFGPLATERDTAFHMQSSWTRRAPDAHAWRLFTGFSNRQRTPDAQATNAVVIERLLDGPVEDVLSAHSGSDLSWTIGARLMPTPSTVLGSRHAAVIGVDLVAARANSLSAFSGRVGELVDGLPARIWVFGPHDVHSLWSSTNLSVFAGDRVELTSRLSLGLGLRFESASGMAEGAANGITWRNWFPRGDLQWLITRRAGIAALAGFGRYGYRLPLTWLAYGDPSAPVGDVYRWNRTNDVPTPLPSQTGPLIARVGPGTGGDPRFSGIDPGLRRPYTDELVLGFESRPRLLTVVRMMAIARREHDLVGLSNVGVPTSTYSVFTVPDPGYGPSDPAFLSIYNRAPSTFGADRYLLTNPSNAEATYVGVDFSIQHSTAHLFVLFGATAGKSEGYAANRGFLASENDQGLIGELYTDPNAATHAQGRLFTERGYTAKLSGTYHFPKDVRFGIVSRYQDGQHFARFLVVDGLNQGPEAVRAFRNGRTRFTYTLTVDAQVQKGFVVGGRHVDVIFGGYNLLNAANEVEELDASAPAVRIASAVQPPRALRAGLRIGF